MTDESISLAFVVDPAFERNVDEHLLESAVEHAFGIAREDGVLDSFPILAGAKQLQVGVRVMGNEEIHRLNREFRHVDRPTDVLSFSFLEGAAVMEMARDTPLHLGDIAVSYPYVLQQAADLGHSPAKELAWLTIHGVLQILGYTHDLDEDAEHMEELERRALTALESKFD